jgi:hypothetical protein
VAIWRLAMYPAALSPAKTDSMESMDFEDLLFWLLGMMNDLNGRKQRPGRNMQL